MGVLIAGLQGIRITGDDGVVTTVANKILDTVGVHGWESKGAIADLIGIVFFAGLCALLVRAAREKMSPAK
jgi:hypothetical protein